MRTLIIIALIAAGGYYGIKAMTGKSEAMAAYEAYKEWERNGNCGEMSKLVEDGSPAQAQVQKLCTPVTVTAYGVTGGQSAAGMIADMNSTPGAAMRTTVFKVESETKASGGNEVTMRIKESVRGRSTAMNPLPPPRTYTVKMKKTGAAWKIVEMPE